MNYDNRPDHITSSASMHGCQRCGTLFRATGRNTKYCPDCSVIMRKLKNRSYNQVYRLAKRK